MRSPVLDQHISCHKSPKGTVYSSASLGTANMFLHPQTVRRCQFTLSQTISNVFLLFTHFRCFLEQNDEPSKTGFEHLGYSHKPFLIGVLSRSGEGGLDGPSEQGEFGREIPKNGELGREGIKSSGGEDGLDG